MRSARAFGKIEAVAMVVVLAIGCAIVLPMLSRPTECGPRFRDSAHLRNITQALQLHALSNDDTYPLPSALDEDDSTLRAERPGEKDITGQILSILIWNGSISTELCVNPAEANELVEQMEEYEFLEPQFAPDPAEALWDPGFRGTPLASESVASGSHTPDRANQSYATILPRDARLTKWANTFNPDEPVVANRGPAYERRGRDWTLRPDPDRERQLDTPDPRPP